MIDITGLDPAELLAALFNNSRQLGLGVLDRRGATNMTAEQARHVIAEHGPQFDYLHGRLLKVDLSGPNLDPQRYDRDLGEGAAAAVVAELRTRRSA